MIVSVKNNEDYVIGYAEFNIVDAMGRFDDKGDYCYVADAWIHPDYRRKDVLPKLIKQIVEHKFTQHCKAAYWVREKHSDDIRPYKRFFLQRRITDGKLKTTESAACCSNA